MPYKTPWGKSGWYSGEVDDNGIPNGTGRMRYKDGDRYDGLWIQGYSKQFLESSHRMDRKFCENRSPWNEPRQQQQQPWDKFRHRQRSSLVRES
mmetsp:Transcript_415/g.592  ORF Transcript_415/g.592 Transcript_415/m.592 type:complete len:94 (+) Transcript_415:2-283(+)